MTADFYLTQNLPISFEVTPGRVPQVVIFNPRTENVFPHDKSETSWQVCSKLRKLLRSPEPDRKIQITLAFPENVAPRCKITGLFITDMIKTVGWGVSVNTTLAELNEAPEFYSVLACGDPVNGRWDRVCVNDPKLPNLHYQMNSSCASVSINDRNHAEFEGNLQERENRPFKPAERSYTAKLTIRISGPVSLENKFCNRGFNTPNNDGALSCKMHKQPETIQPDAEIITGNGTRISCHSVFLSGHSDKLKGLLSSFYKDGQMKTIVMEDMSEIGVKSLLYFLYFGDVEAALADSKICVELLMAAEKYDIEKLQEKMKIILLSKPDAWFEAKSALKLFVFTQELTPYSEIKMLAERITKSKQEELKELEHFEAVLKNLPTAAKDLFSSI